MGGLVPLRALLKILRSNSVKKGGPYNNLRNESEIVQHHPVSLDATLLIKMFYTVSKDIFRRST